MGRRVRLRQSIVVVVLSIVVSACYSVSGVSQDEVSELDSQLTDLQGQVEELRTDLRAAEAALEPSVVSAITLSEFAIQGDLAVASGDATFNITNLGAVIHNFNIEGVGVSPDVSGGDTVVWESGTLSAGTYAVFCSIPGHREVGMEATLTVDGSGVPTHEQDPDYQAMSDAMNASILAYPAETTGVGNQPLEPRIAADGAKEFDITVSIIDWEVSPGRIVQAWAYNGMVPGPMIRVEVGDRVRVNVTNDLPMGTDVHFHGVGLPNAMDGVAPLTQPLIEPGDVFTYEFVAERPAVAMYHAHHHAQIQVPNGLFGVFMIGDVELPRGRTISGIPIPLDLELAAEIPMVLNDAGVIGYSLNGKSFPATQPYVLQTGDWYLVHYFNEGLQIHPMHQHQFVGLVVAKDGIPLESPYWMDTLNVAPGERYSVLIQATDAGAWLWHCHILTHVESAEGVFGMVTAVIVQDG
ncbi:MAG: multicopper oxidase domain-containing protein [Actinomycetota bacterium]